MTEKPANNEREADSVIVRALSWVDDPAKVKKFFWGLVIAGAVLTLLDLFYKKKVYFDIEYVFGFYSFYGFVMCALLVIAAKGLRMMIGRKESYYAPADVESEVHPAFDLDRSEDDV